MRACTGDGGCGMPLRVRPLGTRVTQIPYDVHECRTLTSPSQDQGGNQIWQNQETSPQISS